MPKMFSEDIPDWFDLDKYPTGTDVEEFAYQIYLRSSVGSWKVKPEHITSGKAKSFYQKIMTNGWNDLRESFEIEKEIAQIKLENAKPIKEARYAPTYVGLLSGAYDFDFSEKFDHIPASTKVISINLDFTDDEIEKEFKIYLKRRREIDDNLNYLRNNTQKTVDDWAHCNILAAYDLLFWRSATNDSISLQTIAEALNCTQGVDRLRKTLIPKLENMMQEGVVETLLASEVLLNKQPTLIGKK